MNEADRQIEGKRPKIVQEESTASSGSIGSQAECQDPDPGSLDLRQRRFESIGSVGPSSSTSGLPSPGSITSGPSVSRTGISSVVSLDTTSPMPTSPRTPPTRRDSLNGSLFQNTGQLRPSVELFVEKTGSAGLGQHTHRTLPSDNGENQAAHNFASSSLHQTRSSRRTSPRNMSRHSNRTPTLLQHNISGESSKSSIASALSSGSTAISSLYTQGTNDEDRKATISLPPLSTLQRQPGGGTSYYDPAKSQSTHQLANRTASPYARQQTTKPPFNSAASTGMKFESLQLPLPYNISFGQRPLPRSVHEGKLANIYDIQDVPQERHSLRNLTLDKENSLTSIPPITRSLPEPQHPPHRPNLPTLPSLSHDDLPDPALCPDADPLSVLAYAGRIVGREHSTSF